MFQLEYAQHLFEIVDRASRSHVLGKPIGDYGSDAAFDQAGTDRVDRALAELSG